MMDDYKPTLFEASQLVIINPVALRTQILLLHAGTCQQGDEALTIPAQNMIQVCSTGFIIIGCFSFNLFLLLEYARQMTL